MLSSLRAKRNHDLLRPFLVGNILDIGSGNCKIAELISKEHDISCIDVVDNNKTSLNLKIYDGKKIPFKNKSFDTSLLIYVLHHSANPEYLIKEAERVTKKRIIVFEDVYTNSFSLAMLKLLDSANKITSPNMPMPFNFRKEDEWLESFRRYGNVNVKKIPMILPRRQRMFVIDLKK